MMTWYHTEEGGHTHIRVFMNGAKCGDLVFRNEEFAEIVRDACDRNARIRFTQDFGAIITTGPGAPTITCRKCGMISHHAEDVANRYCGFCHQYHASVVINP